MVYRPTRSIEISDLSPYLVNAMYRWPTASVHDKLDYLAKFIALAPEDPIIEAVASVQPSGDGQMQPVDIRAFDNLVEVWLAHGVPGQLYKVLIGGRSRAGRQITATVLIEVDAALAANPIPTPDSADFGEPIYWSEEKGMFNPAVNLPAVTIAATGNSQATAAIVSSLAVVDINAGAGGGVVMQIPAAQWNGVLPRFINSTPGEVTVYLNGGDQYAAPNTNNPNGYLLQSTQSMTLSVSQSGLVLVLN